MHGSVLYATNFVPHDPNAINSCTNAEDICLWLERSEGSTNTEKQILTACASIFMQIISLTSNWLP